MSPPDRSASSHELLLAQMGWIRRLARRLVADQELAEDLVQDTCIVALERRPADLTKLRRWLASVMRNLVRQHARGAGRRKEREALSARAATHESAESMVERVAVQRELAAHVLQLHEPYRSVLILRFFDEEPPREIARRLGVPVATVNSRIQRGLALLRRRLDAAHGEDGRGWMAALLPVVGRLELSPTTALGGLLMNTKAVLAILLVAAATGAVVLVRRGGEAPARAGTGVPGETTELARAATVGDDRPAEEVPGARPARREELAVSPRPPARTETAEHAPAVHALRVRVLDGEGGPVAGVPIVTESGAELVGTSGPGGWFDARIESERMSLVVGDERWVTVSSGEWSAGTSYDPVVVIAPSIDLAGRVEDSDGRRLRDVNVRYAFPEAFHTRFADVLDATSERSWVVETDPDGRFTLERVPAIEGAALRASLFGYEADELPAPLRSDDALLLILDRPEVPLAGAVRGRVVDPSGAPVEAAHVAMGVESVVTDEAGDFEIDLRYAVTSDELTAVKAGFRPGRMERPSAPGEGTTGWPDFVVVELGAPALTIRGRILDHDGVPVSDAKVWLADPTPTAPIGRMPSNLEALMAGGPVPPQAVESRSFRPERDGDSFTDFVARAGPPSALWFWVGTDAGGRFELPGLDDRHYRLNVLAAGLEIVTTGPIRAGVDDEVVRLPKPDVYPRVQGTVRAPGGKPVAGVSVRPWRPVFDATSRVFGGTSQVMLVERAESVVTDDQGRFSFDDVPRHGVRLTFDADSIVPTRLSLEDVDSPRALDVRVAFRCHLQVVVKDPDEKPYDAIAITDADGHPLDIMLLSEGSVNAFTDVPLIDGKSGVVSISSEARELQFLQDGEVQESVRIDPVPGEVNLVEL